MLFILLYFICNESIFFNVVLRLSKGFRSKYFFHRRPKHILETNQMKRPFIIDEGGNCSPPELTWNPTAGLVAPQKAACAVTLLLHGSADGGLCTFLPLTQHARLSPSCRGRRMGLLFAIGRHLDPMTWCTVRSSRVRTATGPKEKTPWGFQQWVQPDSGVSSQRWCECQNN